MKWVMTALVWAATVVLVACAGPTPPETATSSTVAAESVSLPRTPELSLEEADFIADLRSMVEMSAPDDQLVRIARGVCNVIGDEEVPSRDFLVEKIGTTQWGPKVAGVFVDTSHAHFCPSKKYWTPPAPSTQVTGDGAFEVSTEPGIGVMAPGKWKTAGDPSVKCYWKRRPVDGDRIIDNHYSAGPATVVVKAGEVFETRDCGTWKRVG